MLRWGQGSKITWACRMAREHADTAGAGHAVTPIAGEHPPASFGTQVLAHIRLMRPYAWLWFDGLPSLVLYTLLLPGHRSLAHYLLGLLAGICADAGITTLNDICDIDTDRASS